MTIRRVLIVDDDEDVRTVTDLAARRLGGWETVLAAGGLEGVERARSTRPDVILLDVVMPGVDGPATLALLRDDPETAPIPVVFLTARADPEEIAAYRAMGACGVIVKPFEVAGLVERIRRIVEDG